MINAVQPIIPITDKVDGNDVVQRLRHNQDQDACGEGNDRQNMCSVKGHKDSLVMGISDIHPESLSGKA
jgi:hypothetical protein